MGDYEIFCAFVSTMKHIGDIKALCLTKAGGITVEGILPDGREVHLLVMKTKESESV